MRLCPGLIWSSGCLLLAAILSPDVHAQPTIQYDLPPSASTPRAIADSLDVLGRSSLPDLASDPRSGGNRSPRPAHTGPGLQPDDLLFFATHAPFPEFPSTPSCEDARRNARIDPGILICGTGRAIPRMSVYDPPDHVDPDMIRPFRTKPEPEPEVFPPEREPE